LPKEILTCDKMVNQFTWVILVVVILLVWQCSVHEGIELDSDDKCCCMSCPYSNRYNPHDCSQEWKPRSKCPTYGGRGSIGSGGCVGDSGCK